MKMRRSSFPLVARLRPGTFPLDAEERVHEIRVALKKLRAILRLMRLEVTKETFLREDLTLKRAANQLSPYRDAAVIRKTLRKALRNCGSKAQKRLGPWVDDIPPAPNGNSSRVEEGTNQEHEAPAVRTINHFIRWGGAAGQRLASDPMRLQRGMKWTYERARKKYQKAVKSGDPHDFHDCRMWTKWLFLQIQAVEPLLPPPMAAFLRPFERLQEDLGRHHDIYLALEFVKEGDLPAEAHKCRRELLAVLRERSKKLEKRVRKASGLFTATPEVFVRAMV